MEVKELAEKLVEFCRNGKNAEAKKLFYAENIISIESNGEGVKGYEAVIKKAALFRESVLLVHEQFVSDPICTTFGFAVAMTMDITYKTGCRSLLDELCVYEVKDGKIVFEQFFYR